jgi:lantibiotic modifying enzyme
VVAAGQSDGFGVSWPDAGDPAAKGLCGLGHGVSGIAWALSEADWAGGTATNAACVQEALRYERGWYSPDRCAWADLRQSPPGAGAEPFSSWTAAWCHGAFGIGGLRWRLYEKTGELTALAEATAAIESARAHVTHAARALRGGQLADVTLCHGLAGAIELMLLAYEVSGERDHLHAARRAGDVCRAIHAANGGRWTLGIRGASLVPGLFTGIAGVGATMLRLYSPSAMPSPLLPGRARRCPSAQDDQRIESAST